VLLVQALLAGTLRIASAQKVIPPAASDEERLNGIELYRQKKFTEAARLLRQAVKKNRSDDEAWYYLGLALLHQPKELKAASKAFETALKLRPNFAAARAGLGFAFLLRNKPSEAIREAQAALLISPEIPDAYYIIGVIRLREGNPEETLRNAEAAIRISPEVAAAYLLKSQALVSFTSTPPIPKDKESGIWISRYKAAAEALEKYIQLNPAEKALWADQLEAIRFYVLMQTKKGAAPGLADSSEVTSKVRVLSKPEPSYTEEARHHQVVGTVVLRAVFAADGTVNHIMIIKGLPDGLTQKALVASRLIKFVPATLNGRPVSMFIQLEYNFNLY